MPVRAATGQTTGKWFVKFYAPWCGHCKSLAEPWAELATAMKEEHADSGVVIAKLDATAHKKTAQRFGIQGYPTLKFFADGEVRTYNGGRNLAAMKEYVAGIGSSSGEPGYKRDDGEAVPAGPPWWEELVAKVDPHLVEDVQHIIAVRRPTAPLGRPASARASPRQPAPRAALCAPSRAEPERCSHRSARPRRVSSSCPAWWLASFCRSSRHSRRPARRRRRKRHPHGGRRRRQTDARCCNKAVHYGALPHPDRRAGLAVRVHRLHTPCRRPDLRVGVIRQRRDRPLPHAKVISKTWPFSHPK